MNNFLVPASIVLTFFLTGCTVDIEGFVKSGAQKSPSLAPTSPSTNNFNSVKISPGANQALGSQVKAAFAITTTKRSMVGSQLSAKISFHATRQ